ncbi:MAG: hypothetical protein J0L59_01360 [Xanthomonadales bacterium]|nr:hypothetical protein [Xanthomonadales bacterium]
MNAQPSTKCRLCTCLLDPSSPADDLVRGVCGDCRKHPAAKRLGPVPAQAQASGGPREFTAAEKALIRRVHGYMPATQLLALLNERLAADGGDDSHLHTMEQLHAETQSLPAAAGGADWTSLRKLLAKARRDGVLERITAQVIDDFSVVYALSPAQVLRLKDVVLTAKEADHGR